MQELLFHTFSEGDIAKQLDHIVTASIKKGWEPEPYVVIIMGVLNQNELYHWTSYNIQVTKK